MPKLKFKGKHSKFIGIKHKHYYGLIICTRIAVRIDGVSCVRALNRVKLNNYNI